MQNRQAKTGATRRRLAGAHGARNRLETHRPAGNRGRHPAAYDLVVVRGANGHRTVTRARSAAVATHVLVPIAGLDRLREALRPGRGASHERMQRVAATETALLKKRLASPPGRFVEARTAALESAGRRIAAARLRLGLTQKALGERLRMPQSQIARIEKHPERTRVRTLQRVAAALGADIGQLLQFARE